VADPFVSVEVRGVDELEAALPVFGDQVLSGAAAAGRMAAEHTADLTRVSVPHLTGRLAGSVFVAARKGKRQRAGIGRRIPPYAGWIEFGGTRGRPYIPEGRYLWPSARSEEGLYVDRAEQETVKTIRSFPWPNPS
jgi:hypothetical protein